MGPEVSPMPSTVSYVGGDLHQIQIYKLLLVEIPRSNVLQHIRKQSGHIFAQGHGHDGLLNRLLALVCILRDQACSQLKCFAFPGHREGPFDPVYRHRSHRWRFEVVPLIRPRLQSKDSQAAALCNRLGKLGIRGLRGDTCDCYSPLESGVEFVDCMQSLNVILNVDSFSAFWCVQMTLVSGRGLKGVFRVEAPSKIHATDGDLRDLKQSSFGKNSNTAW